MVIDLYYGLGNQMFIYAFGEYCRIVKGMNVLYNIAGFEKNQDKVKRKLDILQFPHVKIQKDTFLYQPNFHTYRKIFDFIGKKIYLFVKGYTIKHEQKFREFDGDLVAKLSDKDFIFGFFQTEDYLNFIQSNIRYSFEFPQIPHLASILEHIGSVNSISLHIRRGDYVNDSNFRVLGIDYYIKAIEYIQNRISCPYFFIFTDDEKWVLENLNEILDNQFFVVSGNSGFEDMMLMSMCKHNIIANSSFSWWAAWLNKNKSKIVIAPSTEIWYKNPTWYKKNSHYCPSNWIRLS